jgi:hypothetical protein
MMKAKEIFLNRIKECFVKTKKRRARNLALLKKN